MKPFFVYLLRCSDGSLYVGHTDELEQRVAKHQLGEIEGYTQSRRPVVMVWCQETASRLEALSSERQIKGWARAKKEALIAGDWDAVQRHAWGTKNPLPRTLSASATPHLGTSIPQPERGGVREPEREGVREPEGDWAGEPERAPVSEPEWDGVSVVERIQDGGTQPKPVRPEVLKDLFGQGTKASRPQPERGPVSKPERGLVSKPERGALSEPERVEMGTQVLDVLGGDARVEVGRATPHPVRPEVSKDPLLTPLLASSRRALAKSITLLESTRPDHRIRADALLNAVLPHTGNAMRLGISGVPGVGKSTFIETLGLALIQRGHRVAVLAIDPSSSVSGGSILGDKTRMEMLSVNEAAYIRPSPASGTLGGVAEKTREAMLVCEAAGYDVVIVETVGVGQSEIAVASMTDMFVLLQLPNAGDDLQAIKKGVMELADLVVINKADIDSAAATRAEAQITGVLRIFTPHSAAHSHPDAEDARWHTQVMQMSALKGQGLDTFLAHVTRFHELRSASGELAARRQQQATAWMWDLVHARLQTEFRDHPAVKNALPQMLSDVSESRIAPSAAARLLLNLKTTH